MRRRRLGQQGFTIFPKTKNGDPINKDQKSKHQIAIIAVIPVACYFEYSVFSWDNSNILVICQIAIATKTKTAMINNVVIV